MKFVCVLLLGMLLFGGAVGIVSGVTEPPEADVVQQRLSDLSESQLSEAELRAAQQSLEQALVHLEAAEQERERIQDLRELLEQAPVEIEQAQQTLTRLKSEPWVGVEEAVRDAALPALEQRLSAREGALAEAQTALGEATGMVTAAQTRPERAQAEISADQQRIQHITGILKSGREGNREISSHRRDELAAELYLLETRNSLRLQELSGNNVLHELGRAQRDLLTLRIARYEDEIRELQTLIAERRREQSEQVVADLAQVVDVEDFGGVLAGQRQINRRLSEQLLETTRNLGELTQRNLRIRQQLDALTQTERTLDEQISVLQGSRLLSRILYEQREALPDFRIDPSLTDRVADVRLLQFEISQQREQLANPEAFVDRLLSRQPDVVVTEALRAGVLKLVVTRVELLERLNHELNAVLNESITLQINQRQLQSLADSLRTTLDQQMFWVPSNRPLGTGWFGEVPQMLQTQLGDISWGVGLREFGSALNERPALFLPLLLVVVIVWRRRRWFSRKLGELHKDVGNVRRDSQLHTPYAVLINFVMALPGALLLALAAYALQLDGRGQNEHIGAALFAMSQVWLVFYTIYRLLTPGGVVQKHFRWAPEQVAYLHNYMRWLGLVVMLLAGVVTFASRQLTALAGDVLGVFIVLVCYVLMSYLMLKMLWHSPERERLSTLRTALAMVVGIMPVALVIAVGLGYYYTALQLSDRLIMTLYVLMAWGVLEALFMRGLAVAARRLAFQRALARRAASPKETVDGVEVVEEPMLDMEQVNQQSLRLMRLGLLGVALVALYWVWADVIEVFTYLDNVTLYEYASGSGETYALVPISLGDALGAMLIALVALMLARNLPGLLEVMVLSRIRLAQGSAYAITTLLSYFIVSVGIVATLATLGVSWDRLQWLVAALSVGLGFGLQEIFANFVSGLIILFERPVRIGDVVTIGNLSGSVSKIHIRATTIIDFDRKEIIVPNKTFVTNQLINWSLSDTVTRVTIHLGVSYGSDLEKVRSLLLQIADENPRVLKDPEPVVYFLSFGESTLDHELRVHVRDLADRNPTVDEINRRIGSVFRDEDIEIAFRQVDIHIRNLEGLEHKLQTLVTRDAAPDAAPGTV